jgi:hypothetical protein
MLLIVAVHKRGIVQTALVEIGWSSSLKPIFLVDHLSLGLFMLVVPPRSLATAA